ncbi:hypothetical protein LPPLD21_02493 [Lactiplantibacillus paraplantarum]|uniref:Mobile element protein n=1 Tax=Lactiplantibacillus paraplantarum TaxID=60520 RepID=A0ABQ0NCZ2_9LACO|nr:hypothetical protein LPPLD21_02493 [Lactiplantibacillus paraplantarum]
MECGLKMVRQLMLFLSMAGKYTVRICLKTRETYHQPQIQTLGMSYLILAKYMILE